MGKVQKIPLEERIKKAESQEPLFLKVFEIFMDDYFIAFSCISQEQYFADYYVESIMPIENGKNHLMSQFMVALEEQPEEEQMNVLYHILIKPFVETDPLCVWSNKFKPEKERYNE